MTSRHAGGLPGTSCWLHRRRHTTCSRPSSPVSAAPTPCMAAWQVAAACASLPHGHQSLPSRLRRSTAVQGCLASGRVGTARDVHSTMVQGGQEGNERTYELLVEAGIVSGALRCAALPVGLQPGMRCMRAGAGGQSVRCAALPVWLQLGMHPRVVGAEMLGGGHCSGSMQCVAVLGQSQS